MTVLSPGRTVEAAPSPRIGPLGRLARTTYRRRGRTVLAWLLALGVAVGLAAAFGGDFKADYSAPGSDSKQAQTLLEDRFPAQAGDTVDVVVRADGGVQGHQGDVTDLLQKLGQVAHVAAVSDPFEDPSAISQDGTTLVAHLRLDVENPVDMPVDDSHQMLDIADAASSSGFQVALGGQSVQQAEQGAIGSEGLGIAA
ncbi:MAG: MMPL family transporter, partial [Nocardioides sp.]